MFPVKGKKREKKGQERGVVRALRLPGKLMGVRMKLSQKAKNAVYIGALCAVSYFAVYIARNILSAVTPPMIYLCPTA